MVFFLLSPPFFILGWLATPHATMEDNTELPPVSEAEKEELAAWLQESGVILVEQPEQLDAVLQPVQQHTVQSSATQEALRAFLHQMQACNMTASDELLLLMVSSVFLIILGCTELPMDLPQRARTLLLVMQQQQQVTQQAQQAQQVTAIS